MWLRYSGRCPARPSRARRGCRGTARGQRADEGKAAALRQRPIVIEQRAEDRLLVGEVMVEVAGGDAGAVGDFAHARGTVTLMGEERECRVEHLPPAPLRFLSRCMDAREGYYLPATIIRALEPRRHGLAARLHRARPADDPRARLLLRRDGAREERAQHADDELRRARASSAWRGRSSATRSRSATRRAGAAAASTSFLRGVGLEAQGTIPHLLFFAYQGTFAIITAALISGAIVERMRFGPYLAFITLWSLVVYAPVAHWVWGGGWLAKLGALDFAGGTVVHVNAAAAALVARSSSARARTTRGRRSCRRTSRSRSSAPACSGSAGSASTPAARSAPTGSRRSRSRTRCSRRRRRSSSGRCST